MKNLFLKFNQEEEAATAVEYAIMLALIIVVCMQVILANGNEVRTWWENIGTDMDNALN